MPLPLWIGYPKRDHHVDDHPDSSAIGMTHEKKSAVFAIEGGGADSSTRLLRASLEMLRVALLAFGAKKGPHEFSARSSGAEGEPASTVDSPDEQKKPCARSSSSKACTSSIFHLASA